MIEVNTLEQMADNLRLYDVVDGGWEGDPEGADPKTIEDNLKHVGEHLAGVIAFKNFFNPVTVRQEIAPDLMQYGLRIARWGNLPLESLIPESNTHYSDAMGMQDRIHLHTMGTAPVASVILANGVLLGQQMHDEDHKDKKVEAVRRREESLPYAAALLIQASVIQANNGPDNDRFDLKMAFADRIAHLRVRFDVPRLENA